MVNLLITFLLPKVIEKKTFIMFMDHFSCQYKGFLLYGFMQDLGYKKKLLMKILN